MLASVIIGRAGKLLHDTGATRWTSASLLDYLNEARRRIVADVPERFRERRVVQLVAGASQTVPADCAHFFRVVRNMGADGATAGTIIRQVDRASLDAFASSWMGGTGTVVKEFALEDPRQRAYLVYPAVPASPSGHVEIELAAYPAVLTEDTEDIGMADEYEIPLLAWVLHRAFLEETEEASPAKAAAYLEQYRGGLGL